MIEKKDVEFEPVEKETVRADGECSCACGLPCDCSSGDQATSLNMSMRRQPSDQAVAQIEIG